MLIWKFINMKPIYICLTFLLLTFCARAQNSAEDSVKSVINNFFRGMLDGNPELVKTCLSDSAILHTVIKGRDGKIRIGSQPVADFIEFITASHAGDADEKIRFESIKIDQDLASVWTPYQFYYRGAFSHCGVNSIQLIRSNGKWLIQYLIDTRRKEPCNQ